MQYRKLGAAGPLVSAIGFGAFKIGRNEQTKYPASYALPGDRQTERLLNGLLDLGVTLIDTAPAYGASEERIGRFLAHRRSEFVLSTKVGETFAAGRSTYDFSSQAVRRSIHNSLKRLQTEVLDVVLIHSNGDDLAILESTPVVETLCSLKAAGEIRCVGFSGKTAAGAQAALDWADAVMVEYHRDDASHAEAMAQAAARGVGVLVKKGLASGRLPPDEAVRFVLSNPHVSSLVVGGLNLDHLKANIRTADSLCGELTVD